MLEWVDVCTAHGRRPAGAGGARLRVPPLEPGAARGGRARLVRARAERPERSRRSSRTCARAAARPALRDQDLRLHLQEPGGRARAGPHRRAAARGRRLQGAAGRRRAVPPKHANFIENRGERHDRATCGPDRRGPPPRARTLGIVLEPEVQLLGDVGFPCEEALSAPALARRAWRRSTACRSPAVRGGFVALAGRGARLARLELAARLLARAGGARSGHRAHDPRRTRDPAHAAPGRARMTTLNYSEADLKRAVEPFPAVQSVSVDADLPHKLRDQRARAPARGRARVRRRAPGGGCERRHAAAARARPGSCPTVKVDVDPRATAASGKAPSRGLVRVISAGARGAAPAADRAYRARDGVRVAIAAGRRCASARRSGWRRSGPRRRACWRHPGRRRAMLDLRIPERPRPPTGRGTRPDRGHAAGVAGAGGRHGRGARPSRRCPRPRRTSGDRRRPAHRPKPVLEGCEPPPLLEPHR